jgi:hypothetical protein
MTNSTTSHSIRCGFCANLGLPDRVVTTHLVRDCKKLANTKCLQCGELGHTVGRCPLNKDTKPKYSRKSDNRKPFVVRDQARKPAPKTKPVVDADGFQVQTKRGSAHKTVETATSSLAAAVPTSFGKEVVFKTPVKTVTPVKPSTVKAKGAWAAGAPKTKPVEVRPHQEIRPPVPKAEAKIAPKPQAVQYMSTQSTGGNYAAEEELRQKASKHGLSCWADDDDEELDPENDPFFQ